jgi:hypothetical protein
VGLAVSREGDEFRVSFLNAHVGIVFIYLKESAGTKVSAATNNGGSIGRERVVIISGRIAGVMNRALPAIG